MWNLQNPKWDLPNLQEGEVKCRWRASRKVCVVLENEGSLFSQILSWKWLQCHVGSVGNCHQLVAFVFWKAEFNERKSHSWISLSDIVMVEFLSQASHLCCLLTAELLTLSVPVCPSPRSPSLAFFSPCLLMNWTSIFILVWVRCLSIYLFDSTRGSLLF